MISLLVLCPSLKPKRLALLIREKKSSNTKQEKTEKRKWEKEKKKKKQAMITLQEISVFNNLYGSFMAPKHRGLGG